MAFGEKVSIRSARISIRRRWGGRHPSGLNRSSRQMSKSNRYAPRIRALLPIDSSTGIVGSPRRVPLGLRFSCRSSSRNRSFVCVEPHISSPSSSVIVRLRHGEVGEGGWLGPRGGKGGIRSPSRSIRDVETKLTSTCRSEL